VAIYEEIAIIGADQEDIGRNANRGAACIFSEKALG
jgi:hypothetical protein